MSPNATIPTAAGVDWRVPTVNTGEHTAAKASLVRAPNGDVVIPGDTGQVRALRPNEGVRWRTNATNTTRGFHGTPTIATDTVYVGAYDGALYAFDLESGDRHWRVQLGDAIGSSPSYLDGAVYVAVEYYDPSGAMFAVDAVTGEVVWEGQRPTDHPHSTAAIDAERVVVWEEFVSVGCCGDTVDVDLRAEAVEGGQNVVEDTEFTYVERDGGEVAGGWRVQSADGPTQ